MQPASIVGVLCLHHTVPVVLEPLHTGPEAAHIKFNMLILKAAGGRQGWKQEYRNSSVGQSRSSGHCAVSLHFRAEKFVPPTWHVPLKSALPDSTALPVPASTEPTADSRIYKSPIVI